MEEVRLTSSVTVGTFTPSVLLAVARSSGHLESVGVQVVEVPVPSSPAQFRALIDGDLEVALTSPDNVLAYRFIPTNPLGALADVSIVSTVDRGQGLSLWSRARIDPTDVAGRLRGGRFAVDVPTSGFALAMYALVEELGLSREDYEVVPLGSTPNRLRALVEGGCDATMLNAGNDLLAAEAGCHRLSSVAGSCSPYVGMVVCVAGGRHLATATRLADALRSTARDIVDGRLDHETAAAAQSLLGLNGIVAERFVTMLKDEDEGLITASAPDLEGLRTVARLRRRYLPHRASDGTDPLDAALEPPSGLLARVP